MKWALSWGQEYATRVLGHGHRRQHHRAQTSAAALVRLLERYSTYLTFASTAAPSLTQGTSTPSCTSNAWATCKIHRGQWRTHWLQRCISRTALLQPIASTQVPARLQILQATRKFLARCPFRRSSSTRSSPAASTERVTSTQPRRWR